MVLFFSVFSLPCFKNYPGANADLSTTYWQSFIWAGTFSWPSSLCSTMKSFGFISCSVINHEQQRKNFCMENVKPMLASMYSGSLGVRFTASWGRWRLGNDFSFLKTTFNILLVRKQNSGVTLGQVLLETAVWRGSTEGQQPGDGQMGGGGGNRCWCTCWPQTLPGRALSVSAWDGNFYSGVRHPGQDLSILTSRTWRNLAVTFQPNLTFRNQLW